MITGLDYFKNLFSYVVIISQKAYIDNMKTSRTYKDGAEILIKQGLKFHKILDNIEFLDYLNWIDLLDQTNKWLQNINDLSLMVSPFLSKTFLIKKDCYGGTPLEYFSEYFKPSEEINLNLHKGKLLNDKLRNSVIFSLEFLRENFNNFLDKSEPFILYNDGELQSYSGKKIRKLKPENIPYKTIKYLCNKNKYIETEHLSVVVCGCNCDEFRKAIENFNKDFKNKTKFESNLIEGSQNKGYLINPIFSIKLKNKTP